MCYVIGYDDEGIKQEKEFKDMHKRIMFVGLHDPDLYLYAPVSHTTCTHTNTRAHVRTHKIQVRGNADSAFSSVHTVTDTGYIVCGKCYSNSSTLEICHIPLLLC